MKLMVFPGEGRYVHYQDNGENFAYRNGEYNLYEFTQREEDGTEEVEITMLHEGYARYRKIEVLS